MSLKTHWCIHMGVTIGSLPLTMDGGVFGSCWPCSRGRKRTGWKSFFFFNQFELDCKGARKSSSEITWACGRKVGCLSPRRLALPHVGSARSDWGLGPADHCWQAGLRRFPGWVVGALSFFPFETSSRRFSPKVVAVLPTFPGRWHLFRAVSRAVRPRRRPL